MRRPHGGRGQVPRLGGGWTRIQLVLKASLARAWLECPGQQGVSGVRMSESVLWTGSGLLGGSRPGVTRPGVFSGVGGGLGGTLSLHRGPKPTKTASRVSFM